MTSSRRRCSAVHAGAVGDPPDDAASALSDYPIGRIDPIVDSALVEIQTILDRLEEIDNEASPRAAALPRMAEMAFIHPGVGHFSEEAKGPEMAQLVLAMNWPEGR